MSDSCQIDTCTVTVEVSLDTGPRLVGQMFLRPGTAGHGKAQVRYVLAPDPSSDESVALKQAASTHAAVAVLLKDGETVK